MKKYFVYTLFFLFFFTGADAQGTFQPKRIDNTPVGIIYDKEFTFDIRLHTYGFALGLNIGRIKTYYRTRFYQFEIGELIEFISTEKYSDENASFFLDDRNIFGSAGFSRGLKEISLVPGFHAKAGVHLDWGAFDEFVKAIEAGFMLDVFVKKIPILVENNDIVNAENRPFFLNLYLNIQLGKRW